MTWSVLGQDEQNNDVKIFQKDRREGLYIIGATGTGKSTLIENLILQDIDQGLGVCVLDPHGDLVNAVISRMKKRLDNVILIDLGNPEYVAGLNLFHCEHPKDPFEAENVVQAVMHILEKVYNISRDTPLMNQFFINITRTLIYNPQATVLDIPRLLTNEAFRQSLLANVPDSADNIHWFWTELYELQRRGRRLEEILTAVTDKLDEFNSDVLKPWFGQNTRTLNLRQIMDDRKILLVKLKARWQTMNSLIGSILIAQILDAAYSRADTPVHKRKQFNVYADEFQTFASQDFAQLFTEARKYGIGITISHQVFEQLDLTIKATIKQAANIVVFRVSSDNAKEIAGEFDCTPPPGEPIYERMMRNMEKRGMRAYWEPPEAKDDFYQALLTWRRVLLEQYALSPFYVSAENTFYEKNGDHGREYKLMLPIHLPPAVVDQSQEIIMYGYLDRTYPYVSNTLSFSNHYDLALHTNPLNWDTTAYVYSHDFTVFPELYTYLVKYYKHNAYGSLLERYFLRGDGYNLEHRTDGFYPLRDTYYVQCERKAVHLSPSPRRNWHGQVVGWVDKKSLFPVTDFLIRPEIQGGIEYRLPDGIFITSLEGIFGDRTAEGSHMRGGSWLTEGNKWGVYISVFTNLDVDKKHQEVEEAVRISTLNELTNILVPYKQQARFYFDMKTYQNDYRIQKQSTSGLNGMGVNEDHWLGPYYHNEAQLWADLLTWVQQKIVSLERRSKAVKQQLRELALCYHEGDYIVDLGYSLPVTITQLEYKRVAGHRDFVETEREIYRMREGNPPYGSDEVERRLANQIKMLPKFTARVRIASGEYTIFNEKPSGYCSEQVVQQRICDILEQNHHKDKYLRLRSEVENELGQRRQSYLTSPHISKQRHVRQVPLQGKCPTCGYSNNTPGAKFCNQCGETL